MKKLFSKMIILLFIGLVLFTCFKSFFWFKSAYFQIVTPNEIKLEIKDLFSAKSEQIVRNSFERFLKESSIQNFDPQSFHCEIAKKVDVLKDVTFNVDSSKVAKLLVVGVLPKLVINNDFIVADNYKVYAKEKFELFDITTLRSLSISSKFCSREISPKLYNFLQTISPQVWERYSVIYESPTLIKLTEIENKNELVVDEKSIFENEKFENIQKIYSNISVDKSWKYKLKKKLVFDMRFDNRILVKPKDC